MNKLAVWRAVRLEGGWLEGGWRELWSAEWVWLSFEY